MNKQSASHDRLLEQLQTLPAKPAATAAQSEKKGYSEQVSKVVALAVAAELRKRGLKGARPKEADGEDRSGAERRMAGGIGAKRVDVTWATEESGLLIAFSVKSINFKDQKTKNYQKNLANRRGDLLFESITLHRRFPYSVLVGLFFLDEEANQDNTGTRKSTFENAHDKLMLFTGRIDPAGRDEQYEHLYIGLFAVPSGEKARCEFYRVGKPSEKITLDNVLDEAIQTLAFRNADLYTYENGSLLGSDSPKGKNRQDDD
jgi:hypothetical protein